MSNRNFDGSVIIKRLRDKNTAQQLYGANYYGLPRGNPQTTNFDTTVITEYNSGRFTTTEKSLESLYSFDAGGTANYVTTNP